MGTVPHLRLLKSPDPPVPPPNLSPVLVDPPPFGSPVHVTATLSRMADELAALVERDPAMPDGTGRVLRHALAEMVTALDELGLMLGGAQ